METHAATAARAIAAVGTAAIAAAGGTAAAASSRLLKLDVCGQSRLLEHMDVLCSLWPKGRRNLHSDLKVGSIGNEHGGRKKLILRNVDEGAWHAALLWQRAPWEMMRHTTLLWQGDS